MSPARLVGERICGEAADFGIPGRQGLDLGDLDLELTAHAVTLSLHEGGVAGARRISGGVTADATGREICATALSSREDQLHQGDGVPQRRLRPVLRSRREQASSRGDQTHRPHRREEERAALRREGEPVLPAGRGRPRIMRRTWGRHDRQSVEPGEASRLRGGYLQTVVRYRRTCWR